MSDWNGDSLKRGESRRVTSLPCQVPGIMVATFLKIGNIKTWRETALFNLFFFPFTMFTVCLFPFTYADINLVSGKTEGNFTVEEA